MQPIIAVCGPSGSGKSSSLEKLNPATTYFIDVENKGLPFRGANKFKLGKQVTTSSQLKDALTEGKELAKAGKVDIIVIDSFTKWTELTIKACRASFKGYEIYSKYAEILRDTVDASKNAFAPVVWIAMDEVVDTTNALGESTSRRMIAVHGKENKGRIDKEMLIIFFTENIKKPDGSMGYHFSTQTDGITTAKSPKGMFDARLINNDLAFVLEQIKHYYA